MDDSADHDASLPTADLLHEQSRLLFDDNNQSTEAVSAIFSELSSPGGRPTTESLINNSSQKSDVPLPSTEGLRRSFIASASPNVSARRLDFESIPDVDQAENDKRLESSEAAAKGETPSHFREAKSTTSSATPHVLPSSEPPLLRTHHRSPLSPIASSVLSDVTSQHQRSDVTSQHQQHTHQQSLLNTSASTTNRRLFSPTGEENVVQPRVTSFQHQPQLPSYQPQLELAQQSSAVVHNILPDYTDPLTAMYDKENRPPLPQVRARDLHMEAESVRKLFASLKQDFTTCGRIRAVTRDVGSNVVAQQQPSYSFEHGGLSTEQRHWIAGLSLVNAQDALQSEMLRRRHCERRIEQALRQVLELEERLTVSDTLCSLQQDGLTKLEQEYATLIADWTKRDATQREQLTEAVRRAETAVTKCVETEEALQETQTTLVRLRAESAKNDEHYRNLAKERVALQSTNEALAAELQQLRATTANHREAAQAAQQERTANSERERRMYDEICAMERFMAEAKAENARLSSEVSSAEQRRSQQLQTLERSFRTDLEEAVASTRARLSAEFERRLGQVEEDWRRRGKEERARAQREGREALGRQRDAIQKALTERFKGILHVKYGELVDAVQEAGGAEERSFVARHSSGRDAPGQGHASSQTHGEKQQPAPAEPQHTQRRDELKRFIANLMTRRAQTPASSVTSSSTAESGIGLSGRPNPTPQ